MFRANWIVFSALTLSATAGTAAATCPALPLGPLPITIGNLEVSALPSPGATIGAPPVIRFNGATIVVRQKPNTEALEITFTTGSWGPIEAVQRNAAGAVLRTDTLPTSTPTPGQVTYRHYTHGAHEVHFKSGNNEGDFVSVCEALPPHQ